MEPVHAKLRRGEGLHIPSRSQFNCLAEAEVRALRQTSAELLSAAPVVLDRELEAIAPTELGDCPRNSKCAVAGRERPRAVALRPAQEIDFLEEIKYAEDAMGGRTLDLPTPRLPTKHIMISVVFSLMSWVITSSKAQRRASFPLR